MGKETQASEAQEPRYKPWLLSMSFGVLLWVALPYMAIWPLAYIAMAGIVWLSRWEKTPKRFYLQVWIGLYVHWLLACWFATRPHWAGYIGWVFMAGYLSLYYLLFVAFSRSLAARFRRFEIIVYPTVWVSFEWLRGLVITGYSMASLSHTHYELPVFLQVCDLFGSYTLSFVIVLVSTCLILLLQSNGVRGKLTFATVAVLVIGAVCSYGAFRISETPFPESDPLTVAIIQGSVDTEFPWTEELQQKSIEQYRDLTIAARRENPEIDLLVWPENAYPVPLEPETPDEKKMIDPIDFERWYRAFIGSASLPSDRPDQTYFPNTIPLLTGITSNIPAESSIYNSATLIGTNGITESVYHKNHRVMFGEYVPFGDTFPVLYDLAPIPRGILAGKQPTLMNVKGFGICPNICFESTVPHLIRSQINELESSGNTVDILANISNDGWFWGSNCLDQHFASNVFRSVENRKPGIAAVNTGFSAYIDGNGNVVKKGGRRKADYLIVKVYRDGRKSLYQTCGDYPVMGLAIIVAVAYSYCRFTEPKSLKQK